MYTRNKAPSPGLKGKKYPQKRDVSSGPYKTEKLLRSEICRHLHKTTPPVSRIIARLKEKSSEAGAKQGSEMTTVLRHGPGFSGTLTKFKVTYIKTNNQSLNKHPL